MYNFYITANRNKNARIRSRVSKNGKLRTETAHRDFGTVNAAVTTDPNSHATRMFIDLDDGTSVALSGSEARTLYRLLTAHYTFSGKSL